MIEALAAAGLLLSPGAVVDGPAALGRTPAPDPSGSRAAAVPSTSPRASGRSGLRRPAPDTLVGAIRGRVVGKESGDPLSFVIVEVGDGADYRAARTGEDGRYLLEEVPAGRHHLSARTLDRRPLELSVKVPPRDTVHLDLTLGLRPVGLPLLEVLGLSSWSDRNLRDGREMTPGSPAAAELKALEASPGVAEVGLAEEVRPGPGNPPPDPGSTLYVRGASSDLKMVLLDGAPVYAPFHLGGIMDALQPGVIDSSRVYVGGAPARYNGGLSYIMDLRTRPGGRRKTSARGSIDLLGARTQVEGPVGPGSYYVGVRGLHGLGSEGLTDESLPHGYVDVLTRVDMPFSASDRIAVTGFFNRESVGLDPEVGFGGSVHWGNRAGSIRYQHETEDGEVQLVASGGRFRTGLPREGEPVQAAEGRTGRVRLGLDVTRHLADARLQFGGSFEHFGVRHRRGREGRGGVSARERQSRGETMGAYGELVLPVTGELSLRGGLRGDLFLNEIVPRLSPRLTAALDLGGGSVLSVRAGRYHQYVRTPEAVFGSDLGEAGDPGSSGTAERAPVDPDLRVASASHLVVGLDHAPPDGLRVGVEGYFKAFHRVPRNTALRATGLDLWADFQRDAWSAWGGYALALVWSRSDDGRVREEFAGRHLFRAGLRAPLPSEVRLELEAATSAGLPFTPIPTPVEPASPSRDRTGGRSLSRAAAASGDQLLSDALRVSYLRVDAKLSRSWPVDVLDSSVRLTPYLQVINALDRRDALFYEFAPGRDPEPTSVSAVPLLPVAGIEWTL